METTLNHIDDDYNGYSQVSLNQRQYNERLLVFRFLICHHNHMDPEKFVKRSANSIQIIINIHYSQSQVELNYS